MKTIEYRDTMDKSKWERGVWDNEPDKIQWQDEATGLPCLIVRNHYGALCGYVGVSESHSFYGKHYDGDAISDEEIVLGGPEKYKHTYTKRDYDNSPSAAVSVHGGLTFSDFCDTGAEECRGICHKVESGENDKVWWFGFDCGHAFDYMPEFHRYMKEAAETKKEFGFTAKGAELVSDPKWVTYRDVAYVQDQCRSLAKQLKSMQDGQKAG